MKNFPASQTVRTAHETDAQLPTIRLKHWAYIGWYQVRLIYSWAYPVLLLVPLGIALLLIRQYQPEARRSFYLIFEFLLPLAVSFLFVPLILREQQQRTLALVSVTQCPLPFLFVIRLLLITLFLATLSVALALLLHLSPPTPDWILSPPDIELGRDLGVWPAHLAGGPNGIIAVLLTLSAPTFLLAGIGSALAHLTADVRTGYLAIFAMWMLNRAIGVTLDTHPLLHNFYLFVRSSGTGDWLLPKLIQLSAGIGFFILAWLLIHKPERLLQAS